MVRKFVFLVSLLLSFSSPSFGELDDFTVYFINGIKASPDEADKSRKKLHDLVLPDIPNNSVLALYQNNTGALRKMIETVRIQASLDNERQTPTPSLAYALGFDSALGRRPFHRQSYDQCQG